MSSKRVLRGKVERRDAVNSDVHSARARRQASHANVVQTGNERRCKNRPFVTTGTVASTTRPRRHDDDRILSAWVPDPAGGWYYDKNPASGTPTKITACPASCSMFQTDLNGHVDVVLGCPTISVD